MQYYKGHPSNYHTFALFDPPKMANLMTPVLQPQHVFICFHMVYGPPPPSLSEPQMILEPLVAWRSEIDAVVMVDNII